MNLTKKAFLIFILLYNSQFAQDSLQEALKYYPLHIGDYWEYHVTKTYDNPNNMEEWIGAKWITGDTILSNNKKYFIIESNRLGTENSDFIEKRLIRIDSTTDNVYEYLGSDVMIDSLLMRVNDTLYYKMISVVDYYYKLVFGDSVETKLYKFYGVTNENISLSYELAKGFGEIHRSYSYAPSYTIYLEYDLTYAKIDGIEYGVKTDVKTNKKMNEKFWLGQNYPNPFNPSTTINYSLKKPGFVQIKVYDVLGKEMATLVNGKKTAGNYSVMFNGNNLSSGVYFYVLDYGETKLLKKMMLLK